MSLYDTHAFSIIYIKFSYDTCITDANVICLLFIQCPKIMAQVLAVVITVIVITDFIVIRGTVTLN